MDYSTSVEPKTARLLKKLFRAFQPYGWNFELRHDTLAELERVGHPSGIRELRRFRDKSAREARRCFGSRKLFLKAEIAHINYLIAYFKAQERYVPPAIGIG